MYIQKSYLIRRIDNNDKYYNNYVRDIDGKFILIVNNIL
jgi:hypothetical protein